MSGDKDLQKILPSLDVGKPTSAWLMAQGSGLLDLGFEPQIKILIVE